MAFLWTFPKSANFLRHLYLLVRKSINSKASKFKTCMIWHFLSFDQPIWIICGITCHIPPGCSGCSDGWELVPCPPVRLHLRHNLHYWHWKILTKEHADNHIFFRDVSDYIFDHGTYVKTEEFQHGILYISLLTNNPLQKCISMFNLFKYMLKKNKY